MTSSALLALVNALPTPGAATAPSAGVTHGESHAFRSAFDASTVRATASAAPAPVVTPASDPVADAVTQAVAKGVPLPVIVAAAATALGTQAQAVVDPHGDPTAIIAAIKAALEPPDGSSPPGTLAERVKALVAKLRTIADAAARASETITTGQQNVLPGNDLDAANAAKANPAPTADTLLAGLTAAIAALTPQSTVPTQTTPAASADFLNVTAATSQATVATALVDAFTRLTPAQTSVSLAAPVVVALSLGGATVNASVTATGDDDGTHVTVTVPTTAARDAVEARSATIVGDLERSGVTPADLTVVVDPASATNPSASAIAPVPAALLFAAKSAAANAAAATSSTVLTAAASRANATAASTSVQRGSLGAARALPVVESVSIASTAAPAARIVPINASVAQLVANLASSATTVTSSDAVAAGATAAAGTSLLDLAAQDLADTSSGVTTTTGASASTFVRAAQTAQAATLLDVATLAATSAPTLFGVPRDQATTTLSQAAAQAVARLTAATALGGAAGGGATTNDREPDTQGDADAALASQAAPQQPLSATSVATMTPTTAAAADPYGIADQLANALVRGAAAGSQPTASELRVRLSPENLGELSVSVRVDGSSVSAQVTAHDAATHAVLAASGDGLARTLAAVGLQLDGYSVALAGGAAHDFGRGSTQPQQGGQRGRKASFGTEADDADPITTVDPSVPIVQRPGTLDELV